MLPVKIKKICLSGQTDIANFFQAGYKVITKIDIGKGYPETPNIHTGREAGSKSFVQTSTGAIIGIEQANPGITKSGKTSWRER